MTENNENKKYSLALARLSAYLTSENKRSTPERKMVLEQACMLPQPFTAYDLVEVCAPLHLSPATVYNSLDLFVLAHVLHAIYRQAGRTAVEYELMIGGDTQMQFVCQECGRIVKLRDKTIENIIRLKKYSNFDLDHFSLFIYGKCKSCPRKKKKKVNKRK